MKKSTLLKGTALLGLGLAFAIQLHAQAPTSNRVHEPGETNNIQNLSSTNNYSGEIEEIITSIQNLSNNRSSEGGLGDIVTSLQNLSANMNRSGDENIGIQNLGSNRVHEPGDIKSQIQNLSSNRVHEPGETNNIQNLSSNRVHEPGETNNVHEPGETNNVHEPGETNNIQNLSNNRVHEPGETNNIQNLNSNRIEEPGETNNIQNLSNEQIAEELDKIVKLLEGLKLEEKKESDNDAIKNAVEKLKKISEDYRGSSYKSLRKAMEKSTVK